MSTLRTFLFLAAAVALSGCASYNAWQAARVQRQWDEDSLTCHAYANDAALFQRCHDLEYQKRQQRQIDAAVSSMHNSLQSMEDSKAAEAKSAGETGDWIACHPIGGPPCDSHAP